MIPSRVRVAVAGLVAGVVLAGCVGPARTVTTYEGKARRAAADSLSEVETVLVAVRTDLRGNLLQNYFDVLLTTSENNISSIQGSFDSIQPPRSAGADNMRDTLDSLLSDGSDKLSRLRILARREDKSGLASVAKQLEDTESGLQQFVKVHGG